MKSLINRPLKPFSILADMGDNWGFDLFDKSDSMTPPCDMVEKDTHYLYSFDLPGVSKKDLKVEVHGKTLKVSGERKTKHSDKTYSEKTYGYFERQIGLPSGIKEGAVEAHHEDGVLTVAIAKAESLSKAIDITSGKKDGIWNKLLN